MKLLSRLGRLITALIAAGVLFQEGCIVGPDVVGQSAANSVSTFFTALFSAGITKVVEDLFHVT